MRLDDHGGCLVLLGKMGGGGEEGRLVEVGGGGGRLHVMQWLACGEGSDGSLRIRFEEVVGDIDGDSVNVVC